MVAAMCLASMALGVPRPATHPGLASLMPPQGSLGSDAVSAYVFGREGGSAAEYEAYLRAAHVATPEACSQRGLTDVFRTNCLYRHNARKQAKLSSDLAVCKWIADERVPFLVAHQGPAAIPQHLRPLNSTALSIERCLLQNSADAFEAVRVGPVTTHGGKDWTSFTLQDFDISQHVKRWPTAERVVAVRESFLGAMEAGGRLLSYPPLHPHHMHVGEKREFETDIYTHSTITHGDDICLASSGGVGCTIRAMAPGYATLLRPPLVLNALMQDVRASGSANLSYYVVLTMRSTPYDGSYKPLTEMRVFFTPARCVSAFFGTYLVQSDRLSAYWRESTWMKTATVLNAYAHTHPPWMEQFSLYTGASGDDLRMGFVSGLSNSVNNSLSREDADAAKALIAARARAAGASLVCHYRRRPQHIETSRGTAELNGNFYRLTAGCIPFRMVAGAPFVGVVFHSPDSSAAAASAGGSPGHPDARLVGMHAFFRLFVSIEDQGIDAANCDGGCGFDTELDNGGHSIGDACGMYAADERQWVKQWGAEPEVRCLPATESLSPVGCVANETDRQ